MLRNLTLLPLPVLAVLVVVSACSKPRSEEKTHVIPPAAPYVAAAPAPSAEPGPAARSPGLGLRAVTEDPPSAEEVKEFERAVRK